MKWIPTFYLLFLCYLALGNTHPHQKKEANNPESFVAFSPEFLWPTRFNRQIQTFNFHTDWQWQRVTPFPLNFALGFSFTKAKGELSQVNRIGQTLIFQNNAWGLGPRMVIQFPIRIATKSTIAPQISSGLIFYSESFPAGGDIYNFMFRFGCDFQILKRHDGSALSLEVNWMHVSNGQGIVPHNPSYEALGLALRWKMAIKTKPKTQF